MRKYTLLIISSLMLFNTVAFAENPAWIFAHRANTEATIQSAIDDDLNAIEIDVTLAQNIAEYKRCSETWCGYHGGDATSTNLSALLKKIKDSNKIHAVWFDIKTTDAPESAYNELAAAAGQNLGTGYGAVRKFWGVWPASQMDTTYTKVIKEKMDELGGNSQNVFIIEADSNQDSELAAQKCKEWNLQCGLSSGNPFFGSFGILWDIFNIDYVDGDIEQFSNINSIFFWTFNWNDLYEERIVRLLFEKREHMETLGAGIKRCGQEGSGVIIGEMNSVYQPNFCSPNSTKDACYMSKVSQQNGPSTLGNRYSDIGAPRNNYEYSPSGQCK